MWRRAWLLLAAAALASCIAAALLLTPAPASTRSPAAGSLAASSRRAPGAGRVRPRAFASCASLIRYARSHFAVTHGRPDPPVEPAAAPVAASSPAPSGPGATAAPVNATTGAGTTYSTTNVQEPGVDEPDIVKTDGSTIFTVAQGTLRAVAVAGGAPRLVGSLPLGPSGYGAQLLLRGTRLLVVSGAGGPIPLGVGVATPAAVARPGPGSPSIAPSPYYYGGKTTLTEVDVSNPAAMKVTQTLAFEGSFVDARQNGSTARLVISSSPRAIAAGGLRARTAGWVPTLRFHDMVSGAHSVRAVAPCDTIRRPVQFSGLGMLTIVTVNLDRSLSSAHADSLMADAQVVYGSQNSLYVATQKWIDPQTAPLKLPVSETTVIDRFDASNPDRTTLVAAGEVPGYLLNQFSLSENNGFLRVATTSRPIWWATGAVSPGEPRTPAAQSSQSSVTVLATQGATLVPVGQVSGLGQGQRIYSVRFLGDTGYVVTFRQVDPLYVIDLSTQTAPRVAGQLELQGYSAYLHPVGPGLLLGVGQDVGGENGNEPAGTQLELFDVSKASEPRLLARTTLGSGSSTEVQTDHHAFLFWPPTNLAVLPVQIYPLSSPPTAVAGSSGAASGSSGSSSGSTGSSSQFVGAIGFHVDRSGITEIARITHDPVNGHPPAIRRSVVIGDQLFTVSDGGVMASRLDTLARQAFVPFPQPQPQPQPQPGGSPQPRG